MIKKAPLSAILLTFLYNLACAQTVTPLDRFVTNVDFCAFMVAPPDGQTDEFIERYQAALNAALTSLRQRSPSSAPTQEALTQALFALRGRCETTLLRFAFQRAI
jgi:hypothetical protein